MEQFEFEMEDIDLSKETVEAFDQYVESYLKVKEQGLKLEEELAEVNKKLFSMQTKLIEFLELRGVKNYDTRLGKITRVEKKGVKVPDEFKGVVFEKLEEMGVMDAVTKFDTAKFGAWYRQEKESNPELDLPVEETVTKYIKFTK